MTAVIVAQGKPSLKQTAYFDSPVTVTPWCGADRKGPLAQYGVGVIIHGTTFLWGLDTPKRIIQSWRAMKILEGLPQIHNETLAAAWYAANEDVQEWDKRHLTVLERQFPNRSDFVVLRAKALNSYPSNAELKLMLQIVEMNGIEINKRDLQNVYSHISGDQSLRALVQRLQNESDERFARQERIHEESMNRMAAPTPPPAPAKKSWFKSWFV